MRENKVMLLPIHRRNLMSFIPIPRKQRMNKILNYRCCREGSLFQVILSSSEQLHSASVHFKLTLQWSCGTQGECFGIAKKKNWFCLWGRPHFSHLKNYLGASLFKQVVWEIWEDEHMYTSFVFSMKQISSQGNKGKFIGQSGRKLTIGGRSCGW